MSKTVEQIKAELAALDGQQSPTAPAEQPTTSNAKLSQSDAAKLAELNKVLKELAEDDPAPYLAAHKKCAVCLRHQGKQATKCELCGAEGQWEPVTDHHPTWHPLGRDHESTREHLANLRTYDGPFDPVHLRWILAWRQGDGDRQINAATFVLTPFVLSYAQRLFCKQLLEWIEPGIVVPEPEKDELDIAAETAVITTVEEPEQKSAPTMTSEDMWKFRAWKVERQAKDLSCSVSDWIAETMQRQQCA